MMIRRIVSDVFLLGLVLYAPWWVVFGGACIGAFYFSRYYEIIAFGALIDLVYGTPGGVSVGYGAEGLLIGVVLFVLVERLKVELR